ncbi:MAG: hypothetical protein ACFBWO_17765 [Paracoccaceae bacterium]
MRLPETPRQILAGGAAAAAFLAAFLEAALVWWLALAIGLAVWAGVLLAVETPPETAPPRDETAEARAAVAEAAGRFREAARTHEGADAEAFARMAGSLDALAAHYAEDPSGVRRTRRFVIAELPLLVETLERYGALKARARGANAERLRAMAEGLHAYVPVLERLDQACLENDFVEFEVQLGVLAERRARRPDSAAGSPA